MRNKFLIFTGISENHQGQFLSWCGTHSDVYDRAINYYGDSELYFEDLHSIGSEYLFKGKGEIWVNFVRHYDLFKSYDYVLVVDSDLFLDKVDIERTLIKARDNNWSACQWSRESGSYGTFVPLYVKNQNGGIRDTNFVEMCFMVIRKDLLDLVIRKYRELDLHWGEGIDLLLSNVALENKMLPFYIIDDYSFYNPHPHEKVDGREIDYGTNEEGFTRIKKQQDIMDSDRMYFRINYIVECGGVRFHRGTGLFVK